MTSPSGSVWGKDYLSCNRVISGLDGGIDSVHVPAEKWASWKKKRREPEKTLAEDLGITDALVKEPLLLRSPSLVLK